MFGAILADFLFVVSDVNRFDEMPILRSRKGEGTLKEFEPLLKLLGGADSLDSRIRKFGFDLNDWSKWFRNDEEVKFFGCLRNREWDGFNAKKNVQSNTQFTKLYFRRKVHFNSMRSQIKKYEMKMSNLHTIFPLKSFSVLTFLAIDFFLHWIDQATFLYFQKQIGSHQIGSSNFRSGRAR